MSDLIAVQVRHKHTEAQQVCSLELVPLDGQALPAFEAGAHIDVHINAQLCRQYSLCNAPHERHRYQIAVLREPASRGGSAAVHEQIAVGDVLHISAPKNHFALHAAARHHVLIAGGIGVTPILAMAQQLAKAECSFEVHYCGRSADKMAFTDTLKALAQQGAVHLYMDDAGQRLDPALVLGTPTADTHMYVCGPQGFIEWVWASAQQYGWPASQMHREFFALEKAQIAEGDAFELRLARSNLQVTVPRNQTIIEVLAAHNVHIPTVCEAGICGSCTTRVLEGIPDHRDEFLSDEEKAANDQFTPCCSRACTPLLVIDI